MTKITQTGHVPINSLGLIIGKYLRYFKVFLTFYFVPMSAMVTALIYTSKEKLILIYQNAFFAFTTAHTPLAQMTQQQLKESINSLLHAPSFIAIFIIGFVLFFLCGSCLLVGFKHTFYKKVSIFAIAKEGFIKLPEFVWTLVSLCLVVYIPMQIIGIFIYFISLASMSLGMILGLLFFIVMIIFLPIVYFYVPIHFFSANNPFSSAWLSFKTFWKSFFSMLFIGIIFGCLILLSYIPIFFILFLIVRHYFPMLQQGDFIFIGVRVFPLLISVLFPYLGGFFASLALYYIATFVAYPELLENEAGQSLDTQTEYETLPTESFSNKAVKELKVEPMFDNNSVIKTTTGAEGLSAPSAHTNNRPFLNQKLDQTEFDRLTSKDQK